MATATDTQDLFFGGVPVAPDIRRIVKAYPVESLTPGKVIPYKDIEGIIEVNARHSRFRTVTNSWRRQMEKDHGVVIVCPGDLTFKVADEIDKLSVVKTKVSSAFKSSKRAMVVTSYIDRKKLPEDGKAAYDHQRACAGKIMAFQQTARKQIEPI